MTNMAVSLDENNVITNVIVVKDEIPTGFQVTDIPVEIGETFAEAEARYTEYKVRELRDQFLAETDWTANSDVTMSTEMETYRQALRDIPAQSGFPDTVTWPTKP